MTAPLTTLFHTHRRARRRLQIWRSSLANYLDNTYDEKHVGDSAAAAAAADPVVHSQPVGSVPLQATTTAHHPTTATAV
jgi:hypothetical protein